MRARVRPGRVSAQRQGGFSDAAAAAALCCLMRAGGDVSPPVHSRYQRKVADTASGGQEVLIHLQARRLFCSTHACAKATFAEQVPGLTVRYGRRTCGLDGVLQAVALALGGRAGAQLTGRLACAVSRPTLIRLIRAVPDPDGPVIRISSSRLSSSAR